MSGSVVDSLVVELSLDPTKWTAGQKKFYSDLDATRDKAKQTGGEIESAGSEAMSVLSGVRGALLELFALFIGTKDIAAFADGIRQSNTQLGRMSVTLGANTRDLSAWGNAAGAAGGTAQDAYGTFQSLTRSFQQFSITGQSSTIPFFRAMGVELVDTHGKMRDLNDVLLEISAWSQNQSPARAAEFMRGAGISEGLIPLLLAGPDKLKALLAVEKRYAPTPADVKAATDLTAQYGLLDASVHKLGATWLTEATPSLLAFTKALQDQSDWLIAHPTAESIVKGTAPKPIAKLNSEAPDWLQKWLPTLEFFSGAYWFEVALGKADGVIGNFVRSSNTKAPIASKSMSPVAQALLRGISSAEGADYNTLYGGGTFAGNQFPQWAGKTGPDGRPTHAAGRYQFEPATWARVAKALGLKDFSPESQDRGALWLAQQTYKGDLLGDLASGNLGAIIHIVEVLATQWAGLKAHPGALQAQLGAKGAALTSSAGSSRVVANTSSRETHIGTINVNAPNAKDAKGIARGIGSAIDDSVGVQAQGGMQ